MEHVSCKKHFNENDFFKTRFDYKNFETYQQAVFIGLLLEFCSVTIKRPRKITTVTEVHPTIISVDNGEDSIDVTDLTSRHCQIKVICKNDRIKYHAAFCRHDKNRRNFSQNLLIDILREYGYFFESKYAKKSNKTIQLERVLSVYRNNTLLYDFDSFVRCGYEVTKIITAQIKSHTTVIIQKDDPAIKSVMKRYQVNDLL